MPLLVIQTEHLDPAPAAWLAERCDLVQCPSDDTATFNDLLARADGLLIRTYTQVNQELLGRAPKLKVVARAGVGLDNVDIDACKGRRIQVVSTPRANTRAVVELVTAYMLDALRPRAFADRALDQKTWNTTRKELIAPKQLSDLTLGIIGLGRVGSGVARVGVALDMRVMYNDLLEFAPERRFGATPARFEEVLEQADVLTVHPDGRASNRHLINAPALARCKKDVVFINTSRGFIVDAAALAAFLKTNPGAQALLDVHDPEPFGPEYPLIGLTNAHLSPHIAAATATAHRNMSWVVRDLWRVLSGEQPEHPAW
jgi:phosphoglycerate dehydrogenase-like enzyme